MKGTAKFMLDIKILQNAAEIIQYDSPDIPYTIQSRKLSNFTDMRALCIGIMTLKSYMFLTVK